jgi:hypothetical protein
MQTREIVVFLIEKMRPQGEVLSAILAQADYD